MSDFPVGWAKTFFGAVFAETHERRRDRDDLPVLSVTKTRGPMLASERFGKPLHSRDLSKYRVARYGTIVADPMLLWDGSIGRQEVVDEGIVSPDYRVYELSQSVSSDFMRYVVRNPRMFRYYQGGARGTNVRRNRISRSDFLRIPLNLPSLPEQRKIAAILFSVDEVIEKTEGVIKQLQVVKKLMMQDLLTRGIPRRHTRFKKTEIGEVPEEWDVARVQEVGEVLAGRAKDVTSPGKRRPYLRVANVFDGYIDVRDVLEMPFTDAEFARFELRSGDVLLNEGQSLELVGRCSMYRGEFKGPCGIQNALIRFRAGSRTMPEFAEQLFRWCQQSGRFTQIATKTTSIAHLGVQRFSDMKIALPKVAEQHDIVAMLASVDARISAERAEKKQLMAVKSALMSVLLIGELRVTPEEDDA